MEFTLTPNDSVVGHNDLLIRATDAKEVAEICEHFRLDITKHTEQLVAGSLSYLSSGRQRSWFHQFAHVPFDFLKPYYDLLEKVTGYNGPAFEIAAPRYPRGYCVNLCHTHIVVDAAIGADGYHAECFIQAEGWNGQPAAVRGERNLAEYLRAALGDTEREPEYLQMPGGMLKRNPNYLRHHAPHPAATSVLLFEKLFEHWFNEHATGAQQNMWREAEACYRTVVKTDSLAAAMLLHGYDSFHTDNYKTTVTLDEFKALGAKGKA